MKVRESLENVRQFVNDDELTVRHMKILVAITLGFVAGLGILFEYGFSTLQRPIVWFPGTPGGQPSHESESFAAGWPGHSPDTVRRSSTVGTVIARGSVGSSWTSADLSVSRPIDSGSGRGEGTISVDGERSGMTTLSPIPDPTRRSRPPNADPGV